ncbi:methyltransferase domain-containing protein [Leptolyngbya sp. FACHB-36]|uniref:spermine/spermidine synthase domain-containing protein n=1 Tax=Leptolyngbya sp. FACHB-36 TaxID=2692808 RepID=UPI0016819755|nr:methyltransferase domain-containing protein [Leptolyngbya sp. FACHB-36]MBD2021380.1 methyltransferase domain-containing protein [Leptolyngbya sp. FACHB-36]
MPASLFIEHHANGLAFYINGDLQFDTADEAIYHEHLVVPAIVVAQQRFPNTPLRVLICGGGDGLAARDALRFSQVVEITLVDYSAEVLELGRTVFRPYNRGSLNDAGLNRVTVHTQDAFEFVAQLPDACCHVAICDFTFPTCADDTRIYSREWFQQVQRVLIPGGLMSSNGVSPQHSTDGFWCLYQTLLAADLHAKPMQVAIPSFRRHGYGDWGFFLGSTQPIDRAELEFTIGTDSCNLQSSWLNAFIFKSDVANKRHSVNIHTLNSPQLFYYLLNPTVGELGSDHEIDFLTIQEAGTNLVGSSDLLQLESMANYWLQQLHQTEPNLRSIDANQLVPVQHRYHSPRMNQEWLGHVKSLLAEIDVEQLVNRLLERAQELPPKLAHDLKQLSEKLRTKQPLAYLSEHTAEMVTVLSVTLLMANVTHPDAVFAKGYYSGSGGYSSSSGGSYSNSDDGGFFGFSLMMIGAVWLSFLYRDRE